MFEETKNETDEKEKLAVDLLEAAYDNDTSKIKALIETHKFLLNYNYVHEGKTILVIACSTCGINAETVRTLLDLNANPKDFTAGNGWETLHWAAYSTDYDTLNVLLERNEINNFRDNNDNNALHVLIRYGEIESPDFQKCVDLLLEKGIYVYHKNMENKTPIDWAREKKLKSDIILAMQNQSEKCPNINTGRILLDCLKQENETEFVNIRNGEIDDWVDYTEGGHTLLQMCCDKGLLKAAIHLLNKGADHEKTTRKYNYKPITIAVEKGNKKLFQVLLEKYSEITEIPGELLPTLVKYIDMERQNSFGCYEVFMKKMKDKTETEPDKVSYILNEGDKDGNTALHYAVVYAEPEVIKELLSLGASLGTKNKEGIMPIKNIDVQILRNHLDRCVEFDLSKRKTDREEFTVKFNYRTLIPPHVKCVNNINKKQNDDVEAPDKQQLTSTVQSVLVVETDVMNFMSETSELRELLIHPTITSYLYLKWRQIQWIFWINLICYVIFASSLVVYIFLDLKTDKSTGLIIAAKILHVFVTIGSIIIFVRELFQIITAPKKYITKFENYMELSLLILCGMITLDINLFTSNKELFALTILLGAFELLLLLGHHPIFSTNVVMFRTVSYNFYMFLAWYSLPIIAFAVSFYLVFVPDNHNTNSINPFNDTNSSNEEEEPFAQNLVHSFFKTVVMLTGEFNSGDINFDTHPFISSTIFLLFVFTIAIILLNLLNGLAVSDTQMIQNDAELVGYISRTHFFISIESMLMGKIPLVKKYLLQQAFIFPDYVKKYLLRQVFIFPDYFEYEVTFFPRKDGLIKPSTDLCHDKYSNVYLDHKTIQRTNSIIQEEINKQDSSIEKIEAKQDELTRKIDAILTYISTNRGG